jgi:hypothetical protein
MLSPAVHHLLSEFSEFWNSMNTGRAAGHIHTWIIHRVREEWVPWWRGLPAARRSKIEADLASLSEQDSAYFLQTLRATIEADQEAGSSAPNGLGAGDWVFMEFAHIEPLENSKVFAAWRLDRPGGFKALCLHPNKSLLIKTTLLRRGTEPAHYEYNAQLTNTVGVLSALAAVDHLLKRWNRLFFCGSPRGCSHHPLALRLPLTGALIVGPLCIAVIYIAASAGSLSDDLLLKLLYGAGLCTLLTFVFWLIGIINDTLAERHLAAVLERSQVAWALGDVLPTLHSTRNALEIKGESYSVALALSILGALSGREDSAGSLLSWHLRRAEINAKSLGITGDLSPSGRVLNVTGLEAKKEICITEKLTLLSPDQKDATPDDAQITHGLTVRKCRTLEGMIWEASRRSRVTLWLGAASALILALFSFFAWNLVFLPPPPEIEASQPPIIEDRAHHLQHLILHFRTSCPECFILRVNSKFWKVREEQRLAEAKGSDLAVLEIELLPEEGTTGSGMDSVIEILRTRHLPFLQLSPVPVEEITFARINDMYERLKGVGKYAYPNH